MGLEECINEIVAASGERLTKQEAKELMATYREMSQNMAIEDKFSLITDILQRAKDSLADKSQSAILHERATRTRIVLDAERDHNHFKQAPRQGKTPILKAFRDLFRERESIVEVSRREATWWFTTQLQKDGGRAVVAMKTPTMLIRAIDAFFEPRASRDLEGLTPEVKSLVEALDSTTDFIYTAANKAGGYLNWRPTILFSGRVGRSELVGQFTRDAFIDHVTDLMSDEMSVLEAHGIYKHDELEARLGKVYDLITAGDHVYSHGAFADSTQPLVKTFFGKSVNKLSDSIFDLPFKDGAAYRSYFETFNGGDHAEMLMGQLRQVGRSLGMVRAFGPVPEIGYKNMVTAAKNAAETEAEKLMIEGKFVQGILSEDSGSRWAFAGPGASLLDKGAKAALIAKNWLIEPHPDTWFKVLAGESDKVGDQSLATIGRAARGYVALSKLLGFGSLTQFGDLPTTMALLGQIHDNPMTNFHKTLSAYFGAYDPKNKLDGQALQALATSLDLMHGTQLDMYMSGDGSAASGQRAELFDRLFKYTGMARMDWVRIKAVNEYLNAHMAMTFEGKYGDIRPELKKMMDAAKLTEEDWYHLQKGVRKVDTLDGREHLLPEMIPNAEIRFKYLRMLNEANRIAVPRPGAMEQAIITRGTSGGTPEGEILRTIGLFKSFGLAMATRVLPFVNENLSLRGKVLWGTSMVATYMMRDAVKQVLLGKTPKEYDWSDPQTYGTLIAYSGMGGVYSDLIASDMSKFGPMGGAAGMLAGPLITGPVQTGIDWWHSMMSDKTAGEKTNKTIQSGLKLSGLDNLPFVTATMNRLFLYSLYESLEPGWTQKHLGGLKSRGQSEF